MQRKQIIKGTVMKILKLRKSEQFEKINYEVQRLIKIFQVFKSTKILLTFLIKKKKSLLIALNEPDKKMSRRAHPPELYHQGQIESVTSFYLNLD